MSDVTCPRCRTRQRIGAHAEGYRCVGCDATWVFVACDVCGNRFHMQPGTPSWTCPSCGTAHGAAPSVAIAPAPPATGSAPEEPSPPQEDFPGGLGELPDDGDIEDDEQRTQPPILPILAVAGVVLVLVVAFVLTRGGGGSDGGGPSNTPGDPVVALCLDLRNLQTPRVGALTRVLQGLPAHADAIEAAGNPDLADKVRALEPAVKAERDALATQADDTQSLAAMGEALAKLPC
ncbi:MAG TPA: hypothetical protein VK646_10400 [Actinomycetota bacterium]|nr:hypothetical protein [Actinomycetota bacterium]